MCQKTERRQESDLILKVVHQHDHEAFEALVRKHQGPVRQFLRRLTKQDQARADDLAQETFFKAFLKLSGYRGEGRFLSWLFKIAYREFVMDQRHQKPSQTLSEEYELPSKDPGNPEAGITVDQLLHRLSDVERAAILLNYRYGLTHHEIAETLNYPLGTIKTHIRKAKEKLSKSHKTVARSR